MLQVSVKTTSEGNPTCAKRDDDDPEFRIRGLHRDPMKKRRGTYLLTPQPPNQEKDNASQCSFSRSCSFTYLQLVLHVPVLVLG